MDKAFQIPYLLRYLRVKIYMYKQTRIGEQVETVEGKPIRLPVIYYVVVLVVGIGLAVTYGRLVVDPASYVIPDLPLNIIPLIALIVYEVLVLPWTYKYSRLYGVVRSTIIPVILVAIVYPNIYSQILLASIGVIVLLLEAKILVEVAYSTQQVLMVLAGGVKGLAGILALVYALSLVVPWIRDSIITITQFILALTPFIILGAWLFTTIYMLTITREPLKFASMVAPLTLLAIVVAVLAFIYIQPALKNPDLALKTYGDLTRAISLLPAIILLILYTKSWK